MIVERTFSNTYKILKFWLDIESFWLAKFS